MTFKMGETCDGCDTIVKNLKKISESNAKHNTKSIEGKANMAGIKDFLEDAVETNTGATTKVTNNLKKATKYTGETVKYRKRK